MGKVWLLDLKKMSIFTGILTNNFHPRDYKLKKPKRDISKIFCESEKIFRIDIFYTNRL